ncbi:hypothetical protein FRC01_012749, partial [Tulasnella sp. 417]
MRLTFLSTFLVLFGAFSQTAGAPVGGTELEGALIKRPNTGGNSLANAGGNSGPLERRRKNSDDDVTLPPRRRDDESGDDGSWWDDGSGDDGSGDDEWWDIDDEPGH